MKLVVSALTLLLVSSPALADPAAAIARGRDLIKAKNFAAAVEILRGAMPEAESIAKPSERAAAVSALHFYTALALSESGRKADAEWELTEFFRYQPQATLDAARYPRTFVETFQRVSRDARSALAKRGAFDEKYPGYEFVDPKESPVNELWGSSSAFQILASDAEKDEWSRMRTDADRARFVSDFWKRRDPDASTAANELRESILRRVAFADRIFGDESIERGSMTDRGQVYVLLGPPHRVVVRPLNEVEAAFAPRRHAAGEGAAEEWVYRREQLPGKIPTHEVQFLFVSNSGHVTRTLQRTFPATNALGSVKAALSGSE